MLARYAKGLNAGFMVKRYACFAPSWGLVVPSVTYDDLFGLIEDARLLSLIQIVQKQGLMEQLLTALEKESAFVDWRATLTGSETGNQIIH